VKIRATRARFAIKAKVPVQQFHDLFKTVLAALALTARMTGAFATRFGARFGDRGLGLVRAALAIDAERVVADARVTVKPVMAPRIARVAPCVVNALGLGCHR
jgi:hypothetical protein